MLMNKTGRMVALGVLALAGACMLAGCNTVQNRIETASANIRATQPLPEWINVVPEHLAEVDPARLQAEGAALVIGRSIMETNGGDRNGTPHALILRDVATSTIRESYVQRTGTEAEVGWAVLIVPPGNYILNRSATIRRTSVHNRTGQVKDSIVDQKGHPFVPLSQTTRIGAGDVVYVGTVVRQTGPGAEPLNAVIRDESSAAVAWTREHLPKFAPRLQTRLLPRPVKPLS